MKNVNLNELRSISGGCEDSRSLCIPNPMPMPYPFPDPNPFPFPFPWPTPGPTFPDPVIVF